MLHFRNSVNMMSRNLLRKRVLIPAEQEAQQRAFQQRLTNRLENNDNPPRSETGFSWEEIWVEQVPYFLYHAKKVHPLFTQNSPPQELPKDVVDTRFHGAYKMAAKDFVLYLLQEHEDCPFQWSKPQWVFYIRKLYLQALRHFPVSPLILATSSAITIPSDASTVSSDGQCFPQPNRSQPRWGNSSH